MVSLACSGVINHVVNPMNYRAHNLDGHKHPQHNERVRAEFTSVQPAHVNGGPQSELARNSEGSPAGWQKLYCGATLR